MSRLLRSPGGDQAAAAPRPELPEATRERGRQMLHKALEGNAGLALDTMYGLCHVCMCCVYVCVCVCLCVLTCLCVTCVCAFFGWDVGLLKRESLCVMVRSTACVCVSGSECPSV